MIINHKYCAALRYAVAFLAAGGVPALAKVLAMQQPVPPLALRLALAAVEALTLSCPAGACEALLGWWHPSSREGLLANGTAGEEQQEDQGNEPNGDADGEEAYDDQYTGSEVRHGAKHLLQLDPCAYDMTFSLVAGC